VIGGTPPVFLRILAAAFLLILRCLFPICSEVEGRFRETGRTQIWSRNGIEKFEFLISGTANQIHRQFTRCENFKYSKKSYMWHIA
jgi:hypothetical protein